MIEFIFESIGSLVVPYIDSYLKKHPKTGYIKAFFIGFSSLAIPFELFIAIKSLYIKRPDKLLDVLIFGSAISIVAGLVPGILAVGLLFSIKRSIAKKVNSQLANQPQKPDTATTA